MEEDMVKIKALQSFGGADAGRGGKLVSMAKDDIKEVSKEFAQDVINAGHAIEVKKGKKVKPDGVSDKS
jgi:hypothetical protein